MERFDSDFQEAMRPNQTFAENRDSVDSLNEQFEKMEGKTGESMDENADTVDVSSFEKQNIPDRINEIENEPNINEHALSSFKEDNWNRLEDDDMKKMRCEELCRSICDDLGIDADKRPELNFLSEDEWSEKCATENLDPEETNGWYDHSGEEKAIYLRESDLNNGDSKDLANTIAHESRHAYQHNSIDASFEEGRPFTEYEQKCSESFSYGSDSNKDFTENDADEYAAHYSKWLDDN